MILPLSVEASEGRNAVGRVIDSYDGKGLRGVAVKITSNSKMISYCLSKGGGHFTIQLPGKISVGDSISFSSLSYNELKIPLEEKVDMGDVRLTPRGKELEEITVSPRLITSRGDTLTFDVNMLKTAADRNIEDVIKHLPGMSVTDGVIYYNGKAINKFYIEGLDGLGSSYSMASRNISPDDVSAINVYERHQPIKALKEIEASDQAAVNLKLKKRAILRPAGYVTGGVGNLTDEVAWLGKGYMMLINPSSQSYILGSGNNFGIKSDWNPSAGITMSVMPLKNLLSYSPFSAPGLDVNRYTRSESWTAGGKTTWKIGKENVLRAEVVFSHSRKERSGETVTQYSFADGTNPVINSQTGRSSGKSSDLGMGLNFERNTSDFYLSNNTQLYGSFFRGVSSLENQPPPSVKQILDKNNVILGNDFRMLVTKGKRKYDFVSNIAFDNLPLNSLNATAKEYRELLTRQRAKGWEFSTDEKASMLWGVGKNSLIGLTSRFESKLSFINTNGIRNLEENTSESGNNARGLRMIISAGPSYKLILSDFKLNISLPVSLSTHSYSFIKGMADNYKKTVLLFSPSADINWSIGRGFGASFATSYSKSNPTIYNFVSNPIYNTYWTAMTLGSGHPNDATNWQTSTSWSYRNESRGIWSYLSLFASFSNLRTLTSSEVTESGVSTSILIQKNRMDVYGAELFASKFLVDANTNLKLSANTNWSFWKTIQNSYAYNVRKQQYFVQLSSHTALWHGKIIIQPELTAKTNVSRAVNQINNTEDKDVYFDWSGLVSLSVFPVKDLEITALPNYDNSQITENKRLGNLFLDARVKYKFKRWEFSVDMNNLANRRIFTVTQTSALTTVRNTVKLRGIETLFSVRYNF